MNILKAVLKHEVFPALGCTEPIAVAYAAGLAGKQLDADFEEMTIAVDPGVYKNGLAVHVPNTGGERGNLIAGVLGAPLLVRILAPGFHESAVKFNLTVLLTRILFPYLFLLLISYRCL